MNMPSNALKRPISELIEELQKLPAGTTFENLYDENMFYGGQTNAPGTTLGTSYKLVFDICEGLV